MNLNNIETYLIPILFGGIGWFLQSFLKFQKDFYEHRASLGHKGLIDLVSQEISDIKVLIGELQTTTKVNASKIENNHETLRDLSKGSKYRFEVSNNRLSLIEEIMRREGYTIFRKEKSTGEINKDTLDLDDDEP